ncbi:MAG: sigma-54 dependent transcriptional regulator [Xanthomonadaceae bacterium]|nr:sigma-54 dependent transcriptional regulator [Xanthomonadaceae bacterium]
MPDRRGSRPTAILVVEDDAALRELIAEELREQQYVVSTAAGIQPAKQHVASNVCDLVISDMRLPDGHGMELLAVLRAQTDGPGVILITAFGSVPQAVEALKQGADDFLTKPLDLEHLVIRAERVLDQRRARADLAALRAASDQVLRQGQFHGMVGSSTVMQRLYTAIRQVARSSEPVLITGESGTGKELVGRAIHAESDRAAGPYVPVNCASIPETLLEAEFFGHTAGAFTGARAARAGLFMEAQGGTLFLDELGEMPVPLQAKLLRVLQDHRIRPVGGDTEHTVDVRIITATNRDLEDEVAAGTVREDLYYRLEALALHLPPLRERGDDKVELAAHYLARLARDLNRPSLTLSDGAVELIQNYPFPGNVRELANALTRAATFCTEDRIEPRHMPERVRSAGAAPKGDGIAFGLTSSTPITLDELERRYIDWVLAYTGDNKRRAAEILGIGRRTLYRKLDVQ